MYSDEYYKKFKEYCLQNKNYCKWEDFVIDKLKKEDIRTLRDRFYTYKFNYKRMNYEKEKKSYSQLITIYTSFFVCILTLFITTLNSMISDARSILDQIITMEDVTKMYSELSLYVIISITSVSVFIVAFTLLVMLGYRKYKVKKKIFYEEMLDILEKEIKVRQQL